MANFNANIDLDVVVRSKQLDTLEKRLEKLNKFTLSGAGNKEFFNTQNAIEYNKQVDGILVKLAKISRFEQQYSRKIGPQPANANQYSGQIGPGQASQVALRSKLGTRLEKAINTQLDEQATKYVEIERLQRQLLANDNSRIQANQKLNKTQEFIQNRISAVRARQASAAIRGDQNAYPTTIGPEPDFLARNKALEAAAQKVKRIEVAEKRLANTRAEAVSRQKGFAKLKQVELEANIKLQKIALEKSRDAAEEVANQRILNKLLKEAQEYRKTAPAKATGSRNGGGGGGGGMNSLSAGIGFPLLFGGGPGSVLGGALGSLTGGFGAQILLSAIGGIIDSTVAKVAELGQALNPLTGNLDTVLKAAGESSTAFGQLAKQLEEVAGKEKALEMATAQLATVIGAEGVNSLKEFGEETTELSNTLSESLSIASVAVAKLVKSLGLIDGTVGFFEDLNLRTFARNNTTDPELQRLKREKTNTALQGIINPFGNFDGKTVQENIAALDAAIISRAKILKLEQETTVEKKTQAEIDKANQTVIDADVRLKAAEKAVVESGGSLLEDDAYKAREKLIIEQAQQKIDKAVELNDVVEMGKAITQKDLDLAKLRSDKAKEQLSFNEKAAREAEKAGREAERSLEKQLALTRKIANAKIAADLAARINDLQIQPDPTPFSRELSPEEVEVNKLQLQQAKNEAAIGRIKNSNLDATEEELRLQEQSEKNQLARTVIQGEATKAIRQRIEDQTKLIESAETELKLAEAKTDVS